MLTVFLAGYGIYRNSAGTRVIEKDFAGLVPPEDEGVLMADSADPYVHYYSRFNGEYAVQMAREIIALRGDRFFAVSNAGEVANCIRQMGSFISRELPTRVGRREALLVQALTLLAEPQTTAEGRVLTAEAIQEYLRERIAEPTHLDKMAGHFFVSKTSLCRAVKKLCGETIQTMHERQKIEWARTLLKLGTLNVTEVSMRVGYEDPFYFSRVFSKLTGMSPRDWRKPR